MNLHTAPRVLVISFSDLSRDPRVYRQIRTLSKRFSVTALGLGDPGLGAVTYLPAKFFALSFWRKLLRIAWRQLSGRYERYYWSNPVIHAGLVATKGMSFDLVIANDIDALPIADRIRRSGKLVFDAHEYSPKEFENNPVWNLIQRPYVTFLCRKWLPRADAMITVCGTIAEEYRKNFGVAATVMMNVPDYSHNAPSAGCGEKIRLIHHGYAFRVRRIERMIDIMKHLDDRFTFDFMLVKADEAYYRSLVKRAGSDTRIRFIDPVPMSQITDFINAYDVGVFSATSRNLSLKYSLPNKFFEYIQARLAVVISPLPEMEKVVRRFDLGVVARDDSPRAVAECLSRLDRHAIDHYKAQADMAAKDLCYERNEVILMGIMDAVLTH